MSVDWSRAACVGTDPAMWTLDGMWVPGHRSTKEERQARRDCKNTCAGCPILEGCLDWALDHNEYGFWAGTTYRQRRTLRTARNAERRLARSS